MPAASVGTDLLHHAVAGSTVSSDLCTAQSVWRTESSAALIIEKLNVGDGQIAEAILGYINNTQVASLGTFGLIFLCIAVISLLTNVEKAFNHIWGVEQIRPPMRRFADYLSVILVGPVLVISAISMSSTLASHGLVQRLIEMQLVGSVIYCCSRWLLYFHVAGFHCALYLHVQYQG